MTASKKMVEAKKQLQKLGHEVIVPDFTHQYAKFRNSNKIHTESAKNKIEHDLIRKYFKKIKAGDAILIINIEKNGIKDYIGGNAFLEMGFAFILNKPIYLLNKIPNMGYKDEIKAMAPIILYGNLSHISTA